MEGDGIYKDTMLYARITDTNLDCITPTDGHIQSVVFKDLKLIRVFF